MRLDSMERLIESSDFMAFRELVVAYLHSRGYTDFANADGWRDGGSDVSLYLKLPNRAPVAVQVTVERDWPRKLREDAAKVRSRHPSATLMMFFSPRRIPEPDFEDIAEEIQADFGLPVRKVDNQALATEFVRMGRARDVLQLLGIDVHVPDAVRHGAASLRERTAYAYLMFSDPSRGFRERVLDTVVKAALSTQPDGIVREGLEMMVIEELGLTETQAPRVSSAVDRLLQAGAIIHERSTQRLRAAQAVIDELDAADVARCAEWSSLSTTVQEILMQRGAAEAPSRQVAESVLERAGALCMTTAMGLAHVLASERDRRRLRSELERRVREVHAALDVAGLRIEDRTELLRDVSEAVLRSPLASHLIAGEVFLVLLGMDQWALAAALGSSDHLSVLLDASVAIPILASSLYTAVGQRYFTASHDLWQVIQDHGLHTALPDEYAEEAATHLIDAYKRYRAIVDLDENLVFSTNAYVAHYVSLRTARLLDQGFDEYIRGYGVNPGQLDGDFHVVRDLVKSRLEKRFVQIGIEVQGLGRSTGGSWRRAQEAVSYGLRQLAQNRDTKPVEHDAHVIAALMDRDRRATGTITFCTWDRLHHYVYENESTIDWHVMDPAVLADLLTLVRPSESKGTSLTAWSVAMELADEQAQLGAEVWDRLVHIDHDLAFDAQAIGEAVKFRDEYLKGRTKRVRPDELSKAWEEWRKTAGVGS